METYKVIVFNPRENGTMEIEVSLISGTHKDQILDVITKKLGKVEIVSIEQILPEGSSDETIEITCEACRLGCLGQSDHMYPGGCLYDPDY